MIKSKSKLIKKLLSAYEGIKGPIKVPNILIVLWATYGHLFHIQFPIYTSQGVGKYVYWWLSHYGNIKHYGKEAAHEALIRLNHIIILDNDGVATNQPTLIMSLIWEYRPDLQDTFPDILNEDNVAFWGWWITNGAKEYACEYSIPTVQIDKDLDLLISIIWKNNVDLQKYYPDPYKEDAKAFQNWWNKKGIVEYSNTVPTIEPAIENEQQINVSSNKIAIIGHPTGVFGLGEDARLINECLSGSGYEADLYTADPDINAHKLEENQIYDIEEYEDKYLCNIFILPAFDMLKIMLDKGLDIFVTTINIGIWQWELEKFPAEASFAFELVNKVCSISTFTANSLAKSVNQSVPVIPLPVKDVKAVTRNRAEYNLPEKDFIFFFSFDAHSFISRKNPLGLIESFQRAFNNKEQVGLVLKVMNESGSELWNECKRRAHVDKRIYIIDYVMKRDAYLSLLKSVDAVVSLHRSEGFGRLMAEALLMKKPVVVSNYSGNIDFTLEDNSYLVNGDLVPVFQDDYLFSEGNEWFEADLYDAANSFLKIFNDYEESLKKAEKGRKYILDNYSLDATKTKLLDVMANVILQELTNDDLLFDSRFYSEQYPDIACSDMHPFLHYLLHGKEEGRVASKQEMLLLVAKENNKLENSIINKLICGSNIFDKKYYYEHYKDVFSDPVDHYLNEGWRKGYNPSSEFDTNFYLSEYPDVKASGINPLAHYVLYGKKEGRIKLPAYESLNAEEILDLKRVDDGYIFISHEATKTGAPICLLDTCKIFNKSIGRPLVIVLMSGGILEEEFKSIAPVINFNLSLYNKKVAISSAEENIFEKLSALGYRRCIANTVLSGYLAKALQKNFIDTIYLIHEMPELISEYKLEDAADNIVRSNSHVIFAANYVYKRFSDRYGLSENRAHIVPQAVLHNVVYPNKKTARIKLIDKLGLRGRENIKIILGAGLTQHRKGTDLFLSVAGIIYDKGQIENIHFVWLGDRDEFYESWKNVTRLDFPYSEHIHFIDFEKEPAYIFAASDIFLLTSREDPFPGVALIALANNVPVIMFEGTGGIQEILDSSNGVAVPQFNVEAMAQEVLCFEKNHEAKNFHKYIKSFDDYLDNIISIINSNKNDYKVSVVIPNYNYSSFIIERLSTIKRQTHKPAEIIFLDDASTDDSVEVAEEYLKAIGIPYKIIVNRKNQGVYNQWMKGIKEASHDYVWIAEADDVADERFLQTLLTAFKDETVAIAYSQSRIIDQNNKLIQENLLSHTDDLSKTRWLHSYKSSGLREVVDYLLYRNTIPNASACLFNKALLEESADILNKYKYCGDWPLYVSLLRKGKIAYFKEPLNSFRRHEGAVTKSQGKNLSYFRELLLIKKFIVDTYPIHKTAITQMFNYLDKDYQIDNVVVNTQLTSVKELMKDIARTVLNNKRLMFITTNDGSPTGGSEVLWIDAAIEAFKDDNTDVAIVSKNWGPEPKHIGKLIDLGIKIYFKEINGLQAVDEFHPDLVVFSLGDQDEGSDWFDRCRELSIPYVIVNQLTKNEEYLSSDISLIKRVKENYTKAKKVYFTCHNNKKLLDKRLGTNLNNTDIHYNPHHIDKSVSIPYPSTDNYYSLAVPGRLINIHKGQDIIVEVMKQEKWKNRNIRINFYGDGPDKDELKELNRKYHIKNIIFNENKNDILDIWRENQAILLASRMEGVPIVLIGAMMCSRVPIVTNVGGHAEIIKNNKDGFIASAPSVESVDEALERAWKRKEEWEEMGRLSRISILNYMPDNPLQDFMRKLTTLIEE